MPIDSDTLKYAESLFNQRFEDEIQPAYHNRLKAAIARWNPSPQLLFSGSQARIFIAVEARYAREAARAHVECLIEALNKAGLPFDDDAFRKALDDTKKLLEKHSGYSSRKVIGQFSTAVLPSGTLKGVEQDVDNEMRHIHDSILRFLRVKLQESVLTARKTPQSMTSLDDEDRKFARLAIEEARKSVPEGDGRPHPKVGAVVVKNGVVLSIAHRGEVIGNHAEFMALEKKLVDSVVTGATVYTTLEPCTARNHPKIPCVERLIERRVARVVVGMLDPDPVITGRGVRRLTEANIIADLFPYDLRLEVEELNRDFTRQFKQQNEKRKEPSSSVSNLKVERRMKIYNATKEFIRLVVGEAEVKSIEPLFKLARETQDRHLFFGAEIGQYIDEIFTKGKRLHSIWLASGPAHIIGPEDIQEETQIQQWFTDQIDAVKVLFLKYLDFREP